MSSLSYSATTRAEVVAASLAAANPVTGEAIHVTVGPDGIEAVAPAGVVATLVTPETGAVCCGVRGAFCDYAHFFADEGAAAGWLEDRGTGARGVTLPLEPAFAVACLLSRQAGISDGGQMTADGTAEAALRSAGQRPTETFERPTVE